MPAHDPPGPQIACDGVILADKPAGVTSHDVVADVRRSLGGRRAARVGHAGTLDPFATGLLLVLVGRATRVQRFLMALPKTYYAVARLGARSSTGDPEGEIVHTGRVPPPDIELPHGRISQVPPHYSAIRVDGERAYRRARRGDSFELPARSVTVHRFRELWREHERAAFEIECSAGTYVRSLIADLGDAYCEELRRTAIGPFRVEDADAVAWGRRRPGEGDTAPPAATPLPLARALAFLPAVRLDPESARRASHGVAVPDPRPGSGAWSPEVVLLLDAQGPVALAEARTDPPAGERRLKPIVGFRG